MLKQHLTGFEVKTVSEMGWSSMRKGNLMKIAIQSGFEAMLTVDKNFQYQQNLEKYNIAIVVFDVLYNRLQDFTPLIPKFIELQPV